MKPDNIIQDPRTGAIIIKPTRQEKEIEKLRSENRELKDKLDKIVEALPQLRSILEK